MKWTEPPRVPRWMLDHLMSSASNEALAGDLLEEFRSGRSSSWYWRQVLSAITVGCFREVVAHLNVLAFAALWSILTPGWLLTVAKIEQEYNLNERIWQMAWPWSTICELGLLLAGNLVFIGAGIALYLMPQLSISREMKPVSIGRGLLAGLPVLMALWAALIVLPMRFLAQHRPHNSLIANSLGSSKITHLDPLEVARVPSQETWVGRYGRKPVEHQNTLLETIMDIRMSTMLVRLPFFLFVLCTLWTAVPNAVRRQGSTRS